VFLQLSVCVRCVGSCRGGTSLVIERERERTCLKSFNNNNDDITTNIKQIVADSSSNSLILMAYKIISTKNLNY
jgi:hypothetical protein